MAHAGKNRRETKDSARLRQEIRKLDASTEEVVEGYLENETERERKPKNETEMERKVDEGTAA